MRHLLLLIGLIAVFSLPNQLQAQDNWTCDNGPNDVLNAAEAAQNRGDLQKALELAKLAVEVCKNDPLRQGQAQLLVADLQQELTPTATPEPNTIYFPDPSGSYKVGRSIYEWVDPARLETLGPDSNAKRDLIISVWYPAAPASNAKPALYMDDASWNVLFSGYPGINHYVHDAAYQDVPVSDKQNSYPVLIFDPGLLYVPFNYVTLTEDLASQGYIVVGLTHPYSTAVVAYPDGRVVKASTNGQNENRALLGLWSGDVRFVLDQLEKINKADSKDRFSGRLDLTRIGMLGHGFGGTDTIQTSFADARIKLGISLDGPVSTLGSDVDLQKPFMVVGGEGAGAFFSAHLHGDKYSLYITGIQTMNFGDWGFLPSMTTGSPTLGTIDFRQALKIVDAYGVAFFDRYFGGGSIWPSFDEVVFSSIPAAAPTATGS